MTGAMPSLSLRLPRASGDRPLAKAKQLDAKATAASVDGLRVAPRERG